MPEVQARPWFIAGYLHLGAAAFFGLVRAAPDESWSDWVHVLLALSGIFLVLGGLAHGFIAPFLKREPRTPVVAHAALGLVLVADAAALLDPFVGGLATRHWLALYGAAFALLPVHVALTAIGGTPWREGIALFAKDQPFRRGDVLAASAFGTALVALLASATLLALPPRGIPNSAVAVFLLGFALPFGAGFLTFILPRNAKTPLPGLTLHAAALVLLAASALGLALAFAFPLGANFRLPAVTAALGIGFALTGFLRLRFPEPAGAQVRRARPLLRGAFALALLAPAVLLLATWRGIPQLDLLSVALYLHLLLAAALAAAGTLFGAPILLNSVPREGRWAAWAAALAILGAFLLAPAFQYARSPVPGAAVIVAAAIVLLRGLAPMRTPRRECE